RPEFAFHDSTPNSFETPVGSQSQTRTPLLDSTSSHLCKTLRAWERGLRSMHYGRRYEPRSRRPVVWVSCSNHGSGTTNRPPVGMRSQRRSVDGGAPFESMAAIAPAEKLLASAVPRAVTLPNTNSSGASMFG